MFSGNPLDFHYFMATFVESVEKKVDDARGRLTRLIKYTAGDAKELIKNCIHNQSRDCYDIAKKLLQRKYGNPYVIIASYKKELSTWSQIRSGDSSAYQKFCNFLFKLKTILSDCPDETSNSPDMIRLLLRKLPLPTQDAWCRRVLSIRKRGNRESLEDFISFVEDETTLASDPVYSREANSTDRPIRPVREQRSKSHVRNLPSKCR